MNERYVHARNVFFVRADLDAEVGDLLWAMVGPLFPTLLSPCRRVMRTRVFYLLGIELPPSRLS